MDSFWVGKFETSVTTDSSCYASTSTCNNNCQLPVILPNYPTLTNQALYYQFATSLKFSVGSVDTIGVYEGNTYYGLTS